MIPEIVLYLVSGFYLIIFAVGSFALALEDSYTYRIKKAIPYCIIAIILSSWLYLYASDIEEYEVDSCTSNIITVKNESDGIETQYAQDIKGVWRGMPEEMVRLDKHYVNPDEYIVTFTKYKNKTKWWIYGVTTTSQYIVSKKGHVLDK